MMAGMTRHTRSLCLLNGKTGVLPILIKEEDKEVQENMKDKYKDDHCPNQNQKHEAEATKTQLERG